MIGSKEINSKIHRNLSNGMLPRYTRCGCSLPVIYCENGKAYLAWFIYFFSDDDIRKGKFGRPRAWIVADIETGEMIERRSTKDIEFSDASYDVKYNVRTEPKYTSIEEYCNKIFGILDSVRNKIIKGEKFPEEEYQNYLEEILPNVSKKYQRFYRDLSTEKICPCFESIKNIRLRDISKETNKVLEKHN